jgi:hypothetical protein
VKYKGVGWCGTHYERHRVHGTTSGPTVTAEDRFWAKVKKDGPVPGYAPQLGGCWLWTGAKHALGYGQQRIDWRIVPAHRFSYELLVGPIPEGLQIDHLCRVPSCVRPSHLEPVTHRENGLRGIAARRGSG